jgi:hypothetical protein
LADPRDDERLVDKAAERSVPWLTRFGLPVSSSTEPGDDFCSKNRRFDDGAQPAAVRSLGTDTVIISRGRYGSMNQIELFEEIDASPEVVWEVLIELEDAAGRTTIERSVDAIPVVGDRLRSEQSSTRGRIGFLEPEVLIAEENRRLVRLDRVGVPFAFDSYHEFHLEPIDGGRRTRLLQRETARGALVPLAFDERRLEREFEERNRTIKERAESRARA